MKSVLITGCSDGGIGAALAVEYHRTNNYHVFATARSLHKLPQPLLDLPHVTAVVLDVTSQSSIEAAVRRVSALTDGRLDVLINNSGAALSAPVIDTDLAVARTLFEVNVLGTLAVTQAFMPLLVRGANPCIVNNSSINGETLLPFSGVYGASKAAGTIMSESLRLEAQPLGVRVATLITGIVATELHRNEPSHALPPTSYYHAIGAWLEERKASRNPVSRMPVDEYAKICVRRVEGGAAGKVYIGPITPLLRYVHWWLPSMVWTGPKQWQEMIRRSFEKTKGE